MFKQEILTGAISGDFGDTNTYTVPSGKICVIQYVHVSAIPTDGSSVLAASLLLGTEEIALGQMETITPGPQGGARVISLPTFSSCCPASCCRCKNPLHFSLVPT